jgi:hypothetical protein
LWRMDASRPAHLACVPAGWLFANGWIDLQTLFPDALIDEQRPVLEQTIWDDVLDRCHTYSSFVESVLQGIVLFELDSSHCVQQLAEAYGVRSAMADTRTTAVLAAIQASEGSCRITRLEDLSSFAMAWPVRLLAEIGIDAAVIDRLELFGLSSLGHLRMLSEGYLSAQFGSDGTDIHRIVLSLTDRSPVRRYEPAPIIEEVYHFDDPQREPGSILAAVLHCADRAAARLEGHRCSQIDVRSMNRMTGTTIRASQILKTAPLSSSAIQTIATNLLRDVVGQTTLATSVSITLRIFLPPVAEQSILFAAQPDVSAVAGSVLRGFSDRLGSITVVTPDAPMRPKMPLPLNVGHDVCNLNTDVSS